MTVLKLSANKIGDSGAAYDRKRDIAVKASVTPSCRLGGNSISDAAKAELRALASERTSLTIYGLSLYPY